MIATMNPLLGETEVSEQNVAFVVNNHIVWLEVAVQDISVVEFLESKQDFLQVEFCFLLWKFAFNL